MINPIDLKFWNREAFVSWLDLYDTILTDCDAVLWHDNEVIPHVPETINTLKYLGKNIYFVTNNCTLTRHDLWLRANKMNIQIDESHIISPTFTVAEYLKQHLNKEQKVYVVGSAAIKRELNQFNIANFGMEEDIVQGSWTDKLESIKSTAEAEKVAAMVVGFDEHYSFMKMLRASSFLSCNPNCEFLATNSDTVHRYPKFCIPGTGAILQSIQTCTGKKAKLMGKPNPLICENLIKTGVIDPKRTLMIGDCAKTDVLFGKNCGFHTLLVGTGNYKWPTVLTFIENKETNFIPNYYLDSLGDMLQFLS